MAKQKRPFSQMAVPFSLPLGHHAARGDHLLSTHPKAHLLNHIGGISQAQGDRMGAQRSGALDADTRVEGSEDQGGGFLLAGLEEKSDIFKDVCFPFKLGENNRLSS